jgi:Undecaprenyl-phosphate galactose phosphotransferase WbaP
MRLASATTHNGAEQTVPLERLASAGLTSEDNSVASALDSLPLSAGVRKTAIHLELRDVANVVVLLLADIVALLMATYLGYLLWVGPVLHQSGAAYVNLVPLLWLFPLGYAGAGLYPGFGVGAVETLRRLSCCTSFAFLIIAAANFVFKLPSVYSRMGFAVAWSVSLISVPLVRFFVLGVVSRSQWWREPVVLVGNGRWVQQAARSLKNALSLGYRPIGVLSPEFRRCGNAVEDVPVLGGLELAPLLAERGVRVAMMGEGYGQDSALSWLQQHFHRVIVMSEYGDLPVEPVQVCNLGDVLGLAFTNNLLGWRNRFIKRTLDVVLGSILLGFAFPLIVVSGLLVTLSSRGPIFFGQEREGLGGRPIKVWKLRTMYRDAEQRLEEFLAAKPALRHEWGEHFKLTHDPRIIPGVGVFLRRFSLDELPQILSVISGKMSFVGPRPFPRYHLQQLPPEFCELRRRVRPGLTGLWQVMARSNSTLEQQRMYDTYYIRNWSLWLDFYILSRTAFAVLTGRGAY